MFVEAAGHFNFGRPAHGQVLLIAFRLSWRLRFLGWVDKSIKSVETTNDMIGVVVEVEAIRAYMNSFGSSQVLD